MRYTYFYGDCTVVNYMFESDIDTNRNLLIVSQ